MTQRETWLSPGLRIPLTHFPKAHESGPQEPPVPGPPSCGSRHWAARGLISPGCPGCPGGAASCPGSRDGCGCLQRPGGPEWPTLFCPVRTFLGMRVLEGLSFPRDWYTLWKWENYTCLEQINPCPPTAAHFRGGGSGRQAKANAVGLGLWCLLQAARQARPWETLIRQNQSCAMVTATSPYSCLEPT